MQELLRLEEFPSDQAQCFGASFTGSDSLSRSGSCRSVFQGAGIAVQLGVHVNDVQRATHP